MHSKGDLEALVKARLKEAKCLLENRNYSGAYYLAGYAVELALKACIAKQFLPCVIPDKEFVNRIYTHNIGKLIEAAGLKADLESELKKDKAFAGNWGVAKEWNEEARYAAWNTVEAHNLFEAIDNSKHGVLRWIRKYY